MIEIDRLLRLAAHLESLPPETGWDMGRFCFSCGAAACALGHACDIPEFRQLGLHIAKSEGDWGVEFNSRTDLTAAQDFFGLTAAEALRLFDPDSYSLPVTSITPERVAREIRALGDKHLEESEG